MYYWSHIESQTRSDLAHTQGCQYPFLAYGPRYSHYLLLDPQLFPARSLYMLTILINFVMIGQQSKQTALWIDTHALLQVAGDPE
ncbi:hypothetical protein KSX_74720 [Ktedonospora formicarum]|uniref:Uncharacterized protein n=1 Tax=Ktedonospora formicarum TaxID=2778364 RepID=A0A8J3IC07_9CHLR|nr:hypothetical protein KSX_74720 [Ktedonospora formicarum]